ncbi:N-6 DNA methylase [Actinocorallia herbida]|uniref:N-6 DNA methylase n=1 Tax=Actinocorallia herbida TaxID=58109 RepID=UPI0024829C48|nr:N-6 DNA methylase [Actinocorallia herbida]
MLRLPAGIFYAGGVKANVLFLDKRPARPDVPWTTKLWVYDFRTGQRFTLKQDRMTREHLDDIAEGYRPGEPRENRVETERFKAFTYDELVARDKANLDITWLKDPRLEDADSLLRPEFTAIAEASKTAKADAGTGSSMRVDDR